MNRTNERKMVLSRIMLSVSFLLVILALTAPLAGAQESSRDFDPYPLRPADTSSPRDTLRSFLTNATEAIEDWARGPGERSAARLRAHHRTIQTLDFSTTPDGGARNVRIERALFLKEILDRIALPPENEIPGDLEVADGAVTHWTIPDTRITIRRIEDGPRAGQFLFSAGTVQRLDRLYRQAKHLPYQPGATAGIYEAFISSEDTSYALERQVRLRLRPVDTSSPRATWEGFLDSVNRAYALIMKAETALKATPPTMTREQAKEVEITADNLLKRAATTLDLSQVPDALRESVGIETVLQLKEIFDRMSFPPLDSVPNAAAVKALQEEGPVRWRYPNTAIEIAEITEGERQGQFLFSAGSVARISEYYEAVRDLPYRRDNYGTLDEEYKSPGKSEGFYEFYIATPGHLIPHAGILAAALDDLPQWFKTIGAGQTRWQWVALLLSGVAAILVAYGVFRVIKRLVGRVRSPLAEWLRTLAPLLIAFIVIAFVYLANNSLNITGGALVAVKTTGDAIVFLLAAWAVYALCKAAAETIIRSPRITTESSEASLLRIGARVVGFLLGAWIFIDGIRGLGADLIPLLAGLGVGGLAVALAAQSTIANYIGGLILFANKPVRVGDFCRYGEDPSRGWLRIGTVEEIGLISTRLRGIDRTVTTIPNAEFANMHIVNLTKRDRMVFRPTLALRYETTADQLRLVLIKLRELLLAHPRVTDDPARVRFGGFGEFSLNVDIFAYVNTSDWNEFLAIQEDINLRIMKIVEEAGTRFALPSRNLHLERGSGLDSERGQAAEAQVRELASAHLLPFPEFTPEHRKRIMDTLDYPPEGSPDADRG